MKFNLVLSSQFKKDYKLVKRRGYDLSKLQIVLEYLNNGTKLPEKYKEHPLKNNYKGYLDCHIEPDWLLIYKIEQKEKLVYLARTGTHSDLL
jgi:mRNA interferase YafQ